MEDPKEARPPARMTTSLSSVVGCKRRKMGKKNQVYIWLVEVNMWTLLPPFWNITLENDVGLFSLFSFVCLSGIPPLWCKHLRRRRSREVASILSNHEKGSGCLAYRPQMLSKVLSRRRGRTKLSTYQFCYSEMRRERRKGRQAQQKLQTKAQKTRAI